MNLAQVISGKLQMIPEFRGKRRICRALLNVIGLSKTTNVVIDTRSGKFFLPNITEIISFELFVNGYYERGLVNLLEREIPENGYFLDVGANIGSISVALAIARPDVKVVAVEASPWIYEILKKNVTLNGIDNISVYNNAVYNESDKELPMYAPRVLFGKGSLKPVYTEEFEIVKTVTIDDILEKNGIEKISFIKVDVEGFEKTVFEGMRFTATHSKPKVIFEYAASTEQSAGFSAGDAQRVMLKHGYELQHLSHNFEPLGESEKKLIFSDSANILAS